MSAFYNTGRHLGARDFRIGHERRPQMHSNPDFQAGYDAGYEEAQQMADMESRAEAAARYRWDTRA